MDMVRLAPPTELTMPIGEAMFSQRAIRRLDPDRPVTDDQIEIMLNAASKAPNGGNTQPARSLVGQATRCLWLELPGRYARRLVLPSRGAIGR